MHVVTPVYLLVLVMTLFMMAVEVRSPLIMESITVPCLKILLRLVKPPPPSSKTNKVLIPPFTFVVGLRTRFYAENALHFVCCGSLNFLQFKQEILKYEAFPQ